MTNLTEDLCLLKNFDPGGSAAARTCTCQLFSNIFFSEPARPVKAKYYMEPPWEIGDFFFCRNGPGHMTKIAVMPISMVKTYENLPENQKSDDLIIEAQVL